MAEMCNHKKIFEAQIAFVVILLVSMHYKDTPDIQSPVNWNQFASSEILF